MTAFVFPVRRCLEVPDIHVEGFRIDIGQNRYGPDIADRVEEGRADKTGDHDLVIFTNFQGQQGQMQGGGAGTDRNGADDSDQRGQGLLETKDLFSLRKLPGLQDGGDCGYFFLVDGGTGMGNNLHQTIQSFLTAGV